MSRRKAKPGSAAAQRASLQRQLKTRDPDLQSYSKRGPTHFRGLNPRERDRPERGR